MGVSLSVPPLFCWPTVSTVTSSGGVGAYSAALNPKLSSIKRLLIVVAVVPSIVSFAQTASDLADPRLKANANLLQNDSPGFPGISIPQLLSKARAGAPSRGVSWKGLDIVATDDVSASPTESTTTVLLRLYPKQACQADAIVVGHTSSSAYHLSASGMAIYGDYIFVIDTVLKDNQASSIRLKPDIVVTRPGGSLTLADGPVRLELPAFPLLQSGVTYLQFLRYIAQSSAYQALDPFSTLLADANNWAIARKAFSRLAVQGFTRGSLEAMIGNWLTSCKL
jgi:hypothetical protein